MVKRYAQDISESGPRYSRFVLSEVLSHQLHDVSQAPAFDRSMRLLQPVEVKASSQMHRFVLDTLPQHAGDGVVLTSSQVTLPSGNLCPKPDVVC